MLQNLDVWDYILLGIAIVVSVHSLVVLMNRRRELTIERLRREVEAESKRAKSITPQNPQVMPQMPQEVEEDAA